MTGIVVHRQVWKWIRTEAAAPVTALIIVTVLLGALPSALAWSTKNLLDALGTSRTAVLTWATALVTMGASLTLAPLALTLVRGRVGRALTEAGVHALYDAVDHHVQLSDLESPEWQRLLRVADTAARDAPARILDAVCGIVQGALSLVLFTVGLYAISPATTVVVLLAGVPVWFLERRLAERSVDATWRATPAERRHFLFSNLLADPQTGQETRLFCSGSYLVERLMHELRSAHRLYRHRESVQARWRGLAVLFTAAISGAGLLWLATRRAVTPGEITFFLAGVLAVQQSVSTVIEQAAGHRQAALSLRRLHDVLVVRPGTSRESEPHMRHAAARRRPLPSAVPRASEQAVVLPVGFEFVVTD